MRPRFIPSPMPAGADRREPRDPVLQGRRRIRRRDVLRFGTLTVEPDGTSCSCLVWDASESGARIEIEGAPDIPGRLQVSLGDGPPRAATVIWRMGRTLGLRFEGDAARS